MRIHVGPILVCAVGSLVNLVLWTSPGGGEFNLWVSGVCGGLAAAAFINEWSE